MNERGLFELSDPCRHRGHRRTGCAASSHSQQRMGLVQPMRRSRTRNLRNHSATTLFTSRGPGGRKCRTAPRTSSHRWAPSPLSLSLIPPLSVAPRLQLLSLSRSLSRSIYFHLHRFLPLLPLSLSPPLPLSPPWFYSCCRLTQRADPQRTRHCNTPGFAAIPLAVSTWTPLSALSGSSMRAGSSE